LIARNTFKTKTWSYEGFPEQYVQEVLEQSPSHQDKKPMEETRQTQNHLGITGTEALDNTGPQGLPFQSHKNFHSSPDARLQDAPEAMEKKSSHEQVQEQMTYDWDMQNTPPRIWPTRDNHNFVQGSHPKKLKSKFSHLETCYR
jgi:hypothetical protein